VAFDIDANGIVHVSAKDLGTGKEQSIRITAPRKLDKEEIDRMVKDAERFAAEDAKRKEEVETINHADHLIYTAEKSLRDYGDKISSKERGDIESSVNDVKQAIKDKNIERIKKAMEGLTQASDKLPKRSTRRQRSDSKHHRPKQARSQRKGLWTPSMKKPGIAPSKLGKGGRDVESISETFQRNLTDNQACPGRLNPHPEASLAPGWGNPRGEA
jgi:hypothetical protein